MSSETCQTIVDIGEDQCVGLVNSTPFDCDESGLVCTELEDTILDGTVEIC